MLWTSGNSLADELLGLHASIAGGMGWILGQGTKISQAVPTAKKKKKEKMLLASKTEYPIKSGLNNKSLIL